MHFQDEHSEVNGSLTNHSSNSIGDCKLLNLSPVHKVARIDNLHSVKSEIIYPTSPRNRDEFAVFGEYVANELRTLKGEKNLLVAKKKIQDVIFEVKMGMICEPRTDNATTVYAHNTTNIQGGKIYSTPVSTPTHIEPLSHSLCANHTPSTSAISEIIINGACHYANFKVDTQ